MATIKQILNAFGKASARNAVPNAEVYSEIFPPNGYGDRTQKYLSPCDGWIWLRVVACKYVATTGDTFGGLNFQTNDTAGVEYGAFFPVHKGGSYILAWNIANGGYAKFWLYPNKTES